MSTYVITGPDGKKYRVTAPEGATQEEVLARVRAAATPAEPQQPADVPDESPAEMTYAEAIRRAPRDVVETLSNVPESLGRAATETYEAVTHPVETTKSVLKLAKSLGLKGVRKFQEASYGIDIPPYAGEETADAAAQALKDRYGSVEAIRNTVMTDPVGAALDVTSTGVLSKVPKVARLSATLEPYNLAKKATRQSAKTLLPKSAPARVYESGVRLNHPDLDTQNRLVQSAMDEGVIPKNEAGFIDRKMGHKGRRELRNEINSSQAAADALVSGATNNGTGIFASDLFQYFPDLQQKYSGIVPKGKKNRRTINRVEQETMDTIGPRVVLTPDEVQKFKQQANKATFDDYGRPKKDVESEAWSNLRAGAKDALEDAVPDLGKTNQRTATLINLEKPLKKTIKQMGQSRLANYVTLGGAGVAATAAHLLGGPVASAGVLTAAYLAKPASKARIGIALNRLKKGEVNWIPKDMTAAEVRAALYLAGQQQQMQEQEKE